VSTGALVHVSLLGTLEVSVAGHAVPLGGPGRRALLAALALSVGRAVGVPELLEFIWDDRPPATATTKLHGHVSALRQSLQRFGGPDAAQVLQTRPPGYVLCARRTRTDLAIFDQLVRQAVAVRLPSGAARRAQALSAALALWRDTACADVPSARMSAVAAQLDERRWRAMEDLAEARLALREHDTVVDAMQSLVRQAPYRERAWEHLMRAHLGRGDTASALAAHVELCRVLATDLGVAPGRRISQLVGSVRAAHAPSRR
jgi:DNA-binding SARP family transcriptional activator